jgi:hypothetical protein
LEGSVDGSVWTELDAQQDNSQLNGMDLIATWRTTTQKRSRYVRLRQTGLNHGKTDELWLSALELFGGVYGRGGD